MKMKQKGAFEWISFENLEATKMVKHCFTTRLGGVSEGVYESLNLGFNRGDLEENVLKNYEIVVEALDFTKNAFVTADQTHSAHILHVTQEHKGMGVYKEKAYKEIDALITKETNIPLVIFGADCVPIYFLDPVKKVIALAHCGWEGTYKRLAEKTLKSMVEDYGSNPVDVVVAIGPSISQKCFEVEEDVLELFQKNIDFTDEYTKQEADKEGKYYIDLWEINARLLRDMGVVDIEISGLCTVCRDDLFFSHRAMGMNRGSMVGVMELL